jgi:hypothetical protein
MNERSFVDPTTNQMVISDFDAAAYLEWLKGRPIRGSAVLANFLHEWTHRWCFHSPVGSALSLLRMRAATRMLLGRSALEDYAQCITATLSLEPLAEGLALFAEFDTYPGKSPWLSTTLTATSVYFSPALDSGFLLPLESLLQSLRRDPSVLERKAGIYSMPASVSDPYLLGYLSVKSLWCQMAAACSSLNDRDLFLSYLRSYFYDDPGLVLKILSSALDEIRSAEQIVNHINARFRDLVSFDGLSERVQRWVTSATLGDIDVTSIGATSDQSERALLRFDQAVVADVHDDRSERFAEWTLMTLEERTICLIGATKVFLSPSTVSDKADVSLKAGGRPIYTIAAAVNRTNQEGEVIIFGTSSGHGMIVLLGVQHKTWLVSSIGKYTDEELRLAKRHLMNKDASESLHAELRMRLESSDFISAALEMVLANVNSAINEIYGPLCTLNAKEEDWRVAFEVLQKKGLFGLLGEDGELTRAVAAIGLVNTFSRAVGTIQALGPALGVEDAAIETALNLGSRSGMRLVARQGNSAVALV